MNRINNPKWIKHFLKLAEQIASASKDRSTKVGCVIIGPNKEIRTTGYNGAPIGYPDDREHIHTRPAKYFYFVHAEANAIALAARVGTSLDQCIAFITHQPCADCARLLIQAGIKEIHAYRADEGLRERFKESFIAAQDMCIECGISLNTYER